MSKSQHKESDEDDDETYIKKLRAKQVPPESIADSDVDPREHAEQQNGEPVADGKHPAYRNWNFTWNNYPPDYKDRLCKMNPLYIIMGKEIAPDTGTPHIQGFVMFTNTHTLGKRNKDGSYHARSLKGMFPTIHWTAVTQTPHKAAQYCMKDLDYEHFGIFPVGQGERSDLVGACDDLLEGANLDEMVVNHPMVMAKFHKGIEYIYHRLHLPRTERPYAMWFYGASGRGKTKLPEVKHGRDNIYIKQNGKPFWIGYDYQQAVIINEFSSEEHNRTQGWNFEEFLQVLDRTPYNAEVKGGHARLNSPFIYITSPYPPEHFFPDGVRLSQVLRRLDGVYHFHSVAELELKEYKQYPYYSEDLEQPVTATHDTLQKIWDKIPMKSLNKAIARSTKAKPQRLPIDKHHSDEDQS